MGNPERLDRLAAEAAAFARSPELAARVRKAMIAHPRVLELSVETVMANLAALELVLSVSRSQVVRLCCGCPSLFYASPAAVGARIKVLANVFGWTSGEVVRSALKSPQVLQIDAEALRSRLPATAEALGLSVVAFGSMCRRQLGLAWLKLDEAGTRFEALRSVLETDPAALRRGLARFPSLLMQNPGSVGALLEDVATGLGVDAAVVRRAFLRQPSLLGFRAERLLGNVARLAEMLMVERSVIAQAALKFPPLFYLSAEKIAARARAIAMGLGVPFGVVVLAFCRSPSLASREANGVIARVGIALRLARALGQDAMAADILTKYPATATYSTRRLRERYMLARFGIWPNSWAALIVWDDARIAVALGRNLESVGSGSLAGRRITAVMACADARAD